MSERWERVTSLFGAARALDPHLRSSFLSIACQGNDHLRGEVEALLSTDTPDERVLADPPWAGLGQLLLQGSVGTGQVLKDRYRVEEQLATGGQALVYRAHDELLDRPVVIKLMRVEGRRNGLLKSHFEREMKALAHLPHPGVVGILDVGESADGAPFLVIQHVPGMSLREALSQGPMPAPRAAAILRQIGAALHAAHVAGITHGDLKPENVMLQNQEGGAEIVRLIDFGISKIDTPSGEPSITTVMIAGTVRYMAPEQFEGKKSAACDTYSLALVACEMLCGHPDVRALPKETSRETRAALEEALAFRPDDRPADVQGWCERLAQTLGTGRTRQVRRIAVVLAWTLLFGVAVAAKSYLGDSDEDYTAKLEHYFRSFTKAQKRDVPPRGLSVLVPGNAGPWMVAQNLTFNYGSHDSAPPIVISSANGFSFAPGSLITVTYQRGVASAGLDADGDRSNITNKYNSSNGKFPGYYMNPAVPVYGGELVGTFANNGVIAGQPFPIGSGPATLTIPAGANQLLLGINDNSYGDNTGGFTVSVSQPRQMF